MEKMMPDTDEVSPAVQRAVSHFWTKANEYDHDKLQAIYNDFYAMQDKADTVPLSQAMDAVMLALQLIDRLTDPPKSGVQ